VTAVVFGALGQLGTEFTGLLSSQGRPVVALDRAEADIADLESLRSALNSGLGTSPAQPLVFLNCAAYTNVDGAETDREACDAVNVTGARNIAVLAEEHDAELMYFSTDYVFDGKSDRPYVESDAPRPLNHYGRSKLMGEEATASACRKNYILRLAWLHGNRGNNFIRKIVSLGMTRKELKVVDDQWGCPTFAPDVARQALALFGTSSWGLYHCVNEGRTTWYRLAEAVFRRLDIKCGLVPCTSAEYPQKAVRPAWSVLENRRLSELGLDRMRPWGDALADFLSANDLLKEVEKK